MRLQFLLESIVALKTSLEHLQNDIILMLLNSITTIIYKLCFGVAFYIIIKGLVIFIIQKLKNRKLYIQS